MKMWLTSLLLLAALAGGVLAGMPLHLGKMDMKCCDKAKSKDNTPEANGARLCCAMNCTDPAPTSSGGSFNFAPSNVTSSQSIAQRISQLFQKESAEPRISHRYSHEVVPLIFQPKYIQNSSFLI